MTTPDTTEEYRPNKNPKHKEACAKYLSQARENLTVTINTLQGIRNEIEKLTPDNFQVWRAGGVAHKAETIYRAVYLMLSDLIDDYKAPNPFIPDGCKDTNPFASEENY